MEEQSHPDSEVIITVSASDEEEQQEIGNISASDRARPTEGVPRTTELIDLSLTPSTSTNCTPIAVSSGCQTIGADKLNDLNSSSTSSSHECPICLQTCIHPARLPCGHIFCFLCVKGVAYKNRRCAMCRREIPPEFLDHPHLVNGIQDICKTKATEDGYQWFYEGRNGGWWAYDKRSSDEIEEAYQLQLQADVVFLEENTHEILICGSIYTVDFFNMIQYPKNMRMRRRAIQREKRIKIKGVAGISNINVN